MILLIVVLLVFAAFAAFLIQNSMPVTVSFLFWDFEASLAIVVLISFGAGMVLAAAGYALLVARAKMKKKAGL